MPYSAEVVRYARAELARQKEELESRQRSRLQEAYVAVPRLREIDNLLRRNMAYAAMAAFSGDGEGNAAMEQARQENLALQQERQALVDAHFAPDWLDESPLCPTCGGSGYLGSNMCRCLHKICSTEQRKSLRRLCTGYERFENFNLEYYSDRIDREFGASHRQIMQRTFERCRQYAENFRLGAPNLLFNGGTGLGKTFLSACIAEVLTDKGYSVAYESAPQLFAKLEKNRFNPSEETRKEVESYMNCDLLIIDDLGTEMPSSFVTAALYSLLNDRLLENKSMLISTNLIAEELAERYSGQIASRLQGNFKVMTFVGEDVRILKNRGY
ncbi:MAG: ATP-binding protein [Oscillospiraceae bacterium]|nr:ATP-binding protein [Oscillospiraceae bacterium]